MERPPFLPTTPMFFALSSSILAALALSAFLLLASSAAWAVQGKWTSNWDWRNGPKLCTAVDDTCRHATHMALLPGDGVTYHSRILWWSGEQSVDVNAFHGGQWGWNPGADDSCTNTPTNWVDIGVPLAQMDVFCAGQVLLDRSLFSTGGTDRTIGFFGENSGYEHQSDEFHHAPQEETCQNVDTLDQGELEPSRQRRLAAGHSRAGAQLM